MIIGYYVDLIPFVNMLLIFLNHALLYESNPHLLIFLIRVIDVVFSLLDLSFSIILLILLFMRKIGFLILSICLRVLLFLMNVNRFNLLDFLKYFNLIKLDHIRYIFLIVYIIFIKLIFVIHKVLSLIT
jgi:hypothetical protein